MVAKLMIIENGREEKGKDGLDGAAREIWTLGLSLQTVNGFRQWLNRLDYPLTLARLSL